MRFLTYLWLTLLCSLASTAKTISAAPQGAQSHKLSKLEKDLWQSSFEELPFLELKITREIQQNPKSVMGHYLLNQYLIRSYRASPAQTHLLEQAAQIAFQTMELAPESELGIIAILDTLDAMGREDEVESLLNRHQLSFPESSWRYQLAQIRRSSATLTPEETFKKLRSIMQSPKVLHEVVAAYVVSLLSSLHKGEALVKELKKWNTEFPSPTFLFTIANAYTAQKKYLHAHKIYKKLYQRTPFSLQGYEDEALINDGIILTRHLKRYRNAIQILTKRLKRLSTHPIHEPYSLTQLHAHLGWAYLHTSNHKKSQLHFLKSLETTGNMPQMLSFIQEAHKSKRKNFISLIQTAIQKIPGNANIHASLAQAYTRQKRFKHSREYWENAILLQPEQSQFYTSMGLSFYHMADYTKASLWFQKALDVDNADAEAAYNLACMFSLTGEYDEAIKTLEHAFQLDPNLRLHAPQDKDLKQIHHTNAFKQLIQKY